MNNKKLLAMALMVMGAANAMDPNQSDSSLKNQKVVLPPEENMLSLAEQLSLEEQLKAESIEMGSNQSDPSLEKSKPSLKKPKKVLPPEQLSLEKELKAQSIEMGSNQSDSSLKNLSRADLSRAERLKARRIEMEKDVPLAEQLKAQRIGIEKKALSALSQSSNASDREVIKQTIANLEDGGAGESKARRERIEKADQESAEVMAKFEESKRYNHMKRAVIFLIRNENKLDQPKYSTGEEREKLEAEIQAKKAALEKQDKNLFSQIYAQMKEEAQMKEAAQMKEEMKEEAQMKEEMKEEAQMKEEMKEEAQMKEEMKEEAQMKEEMKEEAQMKEMSGGHSSYQAYSANILNKLEEANMKEVEQDSLSEYSDDDEMIELKKALKGAQQKLSRAQDNLVQTQDVYVQIKEKTKQEKRAAHRAAVKEDLQLQLAQTRQKIADVSQATALVSQKMDALLDAQKNPVSQSRVNELSALAKKGLEMRMKNKK